MDGVSTGCPVHQGRDDRKSAKVAEASVRFDAGTRPISKFAPARDLLRSPKVRQQGSTAVDLSKPGEISFFFLDGELHRKRRAAVAGLFAPKTIVTRHHAVMHRAIGEIVAHLQKNGSAPLDELSWQMAVDVAADIVGLTDSDSNRNLAIRVRAVLDASIRQPKGRIDRFLQMAKMLLAVNKFWKHDMQPAIAARKVTPKEDVLSHLVGENFSKRGMIMECLSYGGAGMLTTREFIVMCAWHLFDNEALRTRFLSGEESDQFAILEEILRLEPVAAVLKRRVAEPFENSDGVALQEGEVVSLSIREANIDEAITGPCPFELDPDRAKRMKVVGPYMSFGDGPHRCPGAQVALHETRIFLDRIFRLPGIRLVSAPEISWNPNIQGYELRGAVVACDKV
jgi:cytochrome P450